jgi:hypothetical protein
VSALNLHLDIDQRFVRQIEDENLPLGPNSNVVQYADDMI